MSHSIRHSMQGPKGMSMTSFDQDQVLADSDKYYKVYERHVNRDHNWDAYCALSKRSAVIKKMSDGRVKTRQQIWTYTELARLSSDIRRKKRALVSSAVTCCFLNLFACLACPCSTIYCCKLCCSSQWVDDEEMAFYVNRTHDLAKGFIRELSDQHAISMGTDKNNVPDHVRQDIAFAYSQLGCLSTVNDDDYGGRCCSCCCETGTVICQRSQADAVAYFRQAAAWDPEDNSYAANAQKIDADMKRPIVNVYYSTR